MKIGVYVGSFNPPHKGHIKIVNHLINNYLSKKIDLSHCSAIIFSEKLARNGIIDIINTLGNNIEIRPNANIIISNANALDILENVSSSGESFSSRLYEFIINSTDYTGYSIISNLGDFFYNMNNILFCVPLPSNPESSPKLGKNSC